jgi:hypothetical protein
MLTTTSVVVDQLQAAAGVARSGASDLEAARSQMRYAVEDARSAGFEVGEDLSVDDRMAGRSAAQQAARQAAAHAFAANIGGRAAQLVSTDAEVANRVTAAVAGVGSTFPQTPPTNGQVRAVDNRTFKPAPPQPLPVNPKDMTEAEARAGWAAVNADINAWNARCGRLPRSLADIPVGVSRPIGAAESCHPLRCGHRVRQRSQRPTHRRAAERRLLHQLARLAGVDA